MENVKKSAAKKKKKSKKDVQEKDVNAVQKIRKVVNAKKRRINVQMPVENAKQKNAKLTKLKFLRHVKARNVSAV